MSWDDGVSYRLKIANNYLTQVIEDLNEAPEKSTIVDLLDACKDIDIYYEKYCEECDEQWGDSPGTAYEEGMNLEFYIEASWWHRVSKELRKLEWK